MENKKFSPTQILILLGLVGLGFYIGFSGIGRDTNKKEDSKNTQETKEAVKAPLVDIELVKKSFSDAMIKFGDTSKKVIFLEISDPSCPYCHVAAGYNKELSSEMGSKFKYVEDGGTYLPPVPEMRKLVESGDAAYALIYQNGHGNGEMAMLSLYCAQEMNVFWKVKELVMSNAGYELINGSLKNDRTKAGDLAKFLSSVVSENDMKICLESGKYDGQLSSDQSIAKSLGVSGTPGFFVNETNYSGAYSFEDMSSVVDSALGK